jgi:hypothetical protein
MMRSGPKSEATLQRASVTGALAAPPRDAMLFCNPCLGIPPIVIGSPLLYFGVQVLAGLACLVGLLLFGDRP